jgi:type II secretion system protein N
MMNRAGKIFLYILYAVFALAVFLYFRFPSDLMKEILIARMNRMQPMAQLEMDSVRPTIPPGIKLEPLTIFYDNMPVLRMDSIKITPHLFSMLGQNKKFSFKGTLGDGELSGTAQMAAASSGGQMQGELRFSQVPLEFLEILSQYPNFKTDGKMNAMVNFDSAKGGGSADISLEITPAHIMLEPPLMDLKSLEFSLIKAQLAATPRMVQIRSCEATGDQLEGRLTGAVVLRQPFADSRLTLSLTARPQPAFIADHKNDMIGGLLASGNVQKRGLIFRISGTIDNPNYVIR